MLDPDEETEFRRQLNMIRTGPDDEAFYREMKGAFLVRKYRDERAEIDNRIALAEKMGDESSIGDLLERLGELDQLIRNITEEK